MRCVHCNRLLTDPTVTIKTRSGPLYWGPKCARQAGILPSRRARKSIKPRTERATDHAGQLDWIENA